MGVMDRVHPHTVPKQSSPGFAFRGVHGNNCDPAFREFLDESPHQFVNQTGFAGSSSTSQSNDRWIGILWKSLDKT